MKEQELKSEASTEAIEKETTEGSTKYSGRKSFAFSDKEMYDSVEALLGKKPEGLTNAEFLYQALKQFVESEELNQSFHHLPMQAVDIFKGDLETLNVAFEMIRETFKTQMLASTQLIQQRDTKWERQLAQEQEAFNQRLQALTTEVQSLTAQKQAQDETVNQAKEWKEEVSQLRPTVSTLQQALDQAQQQLQQLQSSQTSQQAEEVQHWKDAYTAVKENVATTTLRLQHAQEQEKQAIERLEELQKEFESYKQAVESKEEQQRDELKATREELATAHQTIQELYQKLLKA